MNNHITCLSLSFSLSRGDLSSINLFWINNFESNLSKLENFFPSFQQSAYIYLRFEYNIYEILSSLQAKRRFYLVLFEKFRNMRKHLDTSSERLKISRIVLELDFGENRGEADSTPRWLSEIITIQARHVDNGRSVEGLPYGICKTPRLWAGKRPGPDSSLRPPVGRVP